MDLTGQDAGFRRCVLACGVAASLAIAAFAAPAAEAKKAKLDGQLVAPAISKGKKVEASVLLSQKSAKKLKLGSPIATLVLKAKKSLKAPSPSGKGKVEISPDSLRSGDQVKGRGKLKGKQGKKLVPKVKAKKLKVKSRESRYSVDELTDALIGLFGNVNALSKRLDDLTTSVKSSLADLQAQIDELKEDNQNLQVQLDAITAQLPALETRLAALEAELAALSTQVDGLDSAVSQLGVQVATLETQVANLEADVATLCGDLGLACSLV